MVEFSDTTTLILLVLAGLRIYLEIIGLDFSNLPVTKALAQRSGEDRMLNFHRMGLYFSIGFIVLFAPQVLFY